MVATKGRSPRSAAKPAARSRPAAARVVRKSRASPKTRLTQLLPLLDKLYGEIRPPETASTLEKAVYLVLREGSGEPTATRALAILKEEFTDWNEVRISRPTELASLLAGSLRTSAVRRWLPRVQRVRELIDQIYNDRNDTSLEFVLELKGKELVEALADLDDLGVPNAWALAQWISGEERLVGVSPEMARASQKLGLTDSAAVTRVRKELSELAGREALVAVQAHLNQLGAMEEPWPASLAEYLV